MASPFRREMVWASSGWHQEVTAALGGCLAALNEAARREVGEDATAVSISHQVTVFGAPGQVAPSFLRTFFKEAALQSTTPQYQVTCTAIYEVLTTS